MEAKLDSLMQWFDTWSGVLAWTLIILSMVVIIIPALWTVAKLKGWV